ncbi:hypothetical protein NDU88_007258 [Pleurodeles waltl]|uniref:Uncharacterized protein n=1 Tax=Pleurodeles waltl TaxID=8319 RepID=A0AAV7VS39_PLEWA|nr:hypothetical protein NDU88_007258 [Pleurodeles waltl]
MSCARGHRYRSVGAPSLPCSKPLIGSSCSPGNPRCLTTSCDCVTVSTGPKHRIPPPRAQLLNSRRISQDPRPTPLLQHPATAQLTTGGTGNELPCDTHIIVKRLGDSQDPTASLLLPLLGLMGSRLGQARLPGQPRCCHAAARAARPAHCISEGTISSPAPRAPPQSPGPRSPPRPREHQQSRPPQGRPGTRPTPALRTSLHAAQPPAAQHRPAGPRPHGLGTGPIVQPRKSDHRPGVPLLRLGPVLGTCRVSQVLRPQRWCRISRVQHRALSARVRHVQRLGHARANITYYFSNALRTGHIPRVIEC